MTTSHKHYKMRGQRTEYNIGLTPRREYSEQDFKRCDACGSFYYPRQHIFCLCSKQGRKSYNITTNQKPISNTIQNWKGTNITFKIKR
jgi:uncharacterized OB-fold protein